MMGRVDFYKATLNWQTGDTMSYSDDTAEHMAWGNRPYDITGYTVRRACRTCGNSYSFTLLATGDRGWAFDCRRCGHTSWFTDSEVETWGHEST
jgi:ribosomal protein L37E